MKCNDGDTTSTSKSPALKKKRRRSEEAAARHRQRYLEILKRREESKSHCSESQGPTTRQSTTHSSSSDTKRTLCKYYYRSGSCVHGTNCSFSHDCVPLTSKDLKLCRYYLQGPTKCRYSASDCKYSHDPSLFICRNSVVLGNCNKELHCDFKHLDAVTISSLDDAEKLKFCYNNKRFLKDLLLRHVEGAAADATSDLLREESSSANHGTVPRKVLELSQSDLADLPWYLQFVHTLLVRDHELNENG
ncbi:zinc finger containing protein [Babesia ovata]|uniref:Zinc finger containing protein n=1 Tax=Babesia ovata TaxID=189622 RepID=A0A2H6KFQ3_9APIC|nr:zinc finger containing protein [Babesia ovata]GBE61820.1 zinc finger containing protein [Babesia ovata]